jgi:N-acetylglutamate synthase-like GNAT family acetyltransferase
MSAKQINRSGRFMDPIHSRVAKAELSDVDGIIALNAQFRPENFGIKIDNFRWGSREWVEDHIKQGHYHVVRDSKGVAAALCLHTDTKDLSRPFSSATTGVMDAIAIRPDKQNSGLSLHLRRWTEEKCRADGITTLVGESFVAYGLEPLYTHWGFKRDLKPAQFQGHDYYLYQKDISPDQRREHGSDRGIG